MSGSDQALDPARISRGTLGARLLRAAPLAALLALAAGLRLEEFERPFLGHHAMRECDTAAIARHFHENGIDPLRPALSWDLDREILPNISEFPLFPALVAVLHRTTGFREANGRGLNLALSLLSLWLFQRLVRRWSGPAAALAATLVLAFSPLHVYLSTAFTRHGGLEQCCMLLWLHLWDLWLRGGKAAWLAAWVPVAGIGLAMTPATGILAGVSLAMAWSLGRWERAFHWKALLAGAAALALPAAWFAWVAHVRGGLPTGLYSPGTALRDWTSPAYWVAWLDGRWFLTMGRMALLTAGTWAALALAACGLALRRPAPPAAWLLSAALYFAADSYVVTGFLHEYYFVIWAPALAWLAGAALAFLAALVRPAAPAALAVLLLALAACGVHEGRARVAGWYRLAPVRPVDLLGWDRLVPRADRVIYANLLGDVIYPADRKGWRLDLSSPDAPKRAAELLGKGARWILVGRKGLGQGGGASLEESLGLDTIKRMGLERIEPPEPLRGLLEPRLNLWRK